MKFRENKKLILSGVILLVILCAAGIFMSLDMNSIINGIKTLPSGIKEVLMVVVISLQIFIAFIPGEPLELAAGYMFGSLWGTLICLIGSFIGTVIVYYLVKLFGMKIIRIMFKEEQIDKVQSMFENKKSLFWVFLLFLIPGTPKDVMTYLVSLSNVKLYKWLLLTTFGRVPSIVTSTFITGSIKEQDYFLALIVAGITLVAVIGGIVYCKKFHISMKKR
ncbi:VTT domain-containing protein [Anaerofustis sp.]|uniref:TVP38/TMEM64 family protein n=1 Tax=Anaerofustis sp. TaxID=1872517 RepID=UPI0025BC7DB3|nr:VTT domain-containing protein [Anaerofustis sp.]